MIVDMVALAAVLAALVVGALKWFRVAQREHYVAGRTRTIARIWRSRSRLDAVLDAASAVLALAAALAVLASEPWRGALTLLAVPAAALGALVPLGLRVRGRTSRLAWTGRLKRAVAAWAVAVLVLGAGLWWALGMGATATLAVSVPFTVDLTMAVMERVERRLSAPFVAKAKQRLSRVRPTIVAVTGSYGKTSTKGLIAHLLSTSRSVVASPASFNNRLGLSRAVNDHLVDGTEVFVAEMGTFGPGEIRELCELFPPDVAAITTIGEAHLERMGSREVVAAAKGEITERARTVVLPIDDPLLADLADRTRDAGKRVVTVSTRGSEADVVVDAEAREARIGATTLALPDGVPHPVNLGVALGVALAVDVAPEGLATRLRQAPPRAAHRAEVHTGPGMAVVDDTYNANPVGALAALEEAAALAAERGGPLVVVTPGIVELGAVQAERNAEFARAAAQAGAHLVVVGRTNRAALLAGATEAGATPDVVATREEAVPVATAAAGGKGVVLYENDLPDHYP